MSTIHFIGGEKGGVGKSLVAQTHQALIQWMEESGMLELAREFGITVRYWHVMDSGKDSVDLLQKLFDRFESQLDYVLVLNQLRGDDFGLFELSGLRERASFWAAAHGGEHAFSGLGLLERQRVKLWLNKAYAGLATPLA